MNKHGVSRRWFIEADVKHLKSGALRTITSINHKYNQEYSKLKKENSLKVYFKDFVHGYRTVF